MVTFDIKLKRESMYSDDNIAQFNPDISKLVCFGLDSAPQMNTSGFVKNNGAVAKSAI